MDFTFTALLEDRPGPQWQRLFQTLWPSYRKWFLRDGIAQRATYLEGRRALARHMPELMPLYERLCELSGGGDMEARFLSLYRPPPYLSGCSQAVWPGPTPLLVRNYDYSPYAFEGLLLKTRWLGKSVMGMSDCLTGLLDGVNEDGLCVSLTFGGRRVVGEGFGVPLILRYVLETCTTTKDATKTLCRVPTHMAYNVTILDAQGHHATVYLAPDREAVVTELPAATNHQERIEWARHARATASVQRERFILDRLMQRYMPAEEFVGAFLKTPLYAHAFDRGFGTLYTAGYQPQQRALTLYWPDAAHRFTLAGFEAARWQVLYPMAA